MPETGRQKISRLLYGDASWTMRPVPADERLVIASARERIANSFAPLLYARNSRSLTYRSINAEQASRVAIIMLHDAYPDPANPQRWTNYWNHDVEPFILGLTDGTELRMGIASVNNASVNSGSNSLILQLTESNGSNPLPIVHLTDWSSGMEVGPVWTADLTPRNIAAIMRPYALVDLKRDADRSAIADYIRLIRKGLPENQIQEEIAAFMLFIDRTSNFRTPEPHSLHTAKVQ